MDDRLEYDEERLAAITWSQIAQAGDVRAVRLVARLGYHAALKALESGEDLDPAQIVAAVGWRENLQRIRNQGPYHVNTLERMGVQVLIPSDASWPAQLNDLGDRRPLTLWVRGNAEARSACLAGPAISIVGARAASNRGLRVSSDFSFDLAKDFTIVSGGAFGIDAAAHRGALLARGNTIIFTAAGVDRPYPASHADLYTQVLGHSGLVISEWPLGSAPHAHRFLLRNRMIAAFSKATVVVEASVRSGALNTAREALEMGREVGAVPGPIDSPYSVGCHDLIRSGATLIATPAHARELANPIGSQLLLDLDSASTSSSLGAGAAEANGAPSRTGWSDEMAMVYDAVPKVQPARLESIARVAHVDLTKTRIVLSKLEVAGHVKAKDGRWVKS